MTQSYAGSENHIRQNVKKPGAVFDHVGYDVTLDSLSTSWSSKHLYGSYVAYV